MGYQESPARPPPRRPRDGPVPDGSQPLSESPPPAARGLFCCPAMAVQRGTTAFLLPLASMPPPRSSISLFGDRPRPPQSAGYVDGLGCSAAGAATSLWCWAFGGHQWWPTVRNRPRWQTQPAFIPGILAWCWLEPEGAGQPAEERGQAQGLHFGSQPGCVTQAHPWNIASFFLIRTLPANWLAVQALRHERRFLGGQQFPAWWVEKTDPYRNRLTRRWLKADR